MAVCESTKREALRLCRPVLEGAARFTGAPLATLHGEYMATAMRGVLLVEDDPDVRELVGEALLEEGYSVYPAENGLRGLELARELKPTVILLDLMMPVMNGWQFLAQQRAEPDLAPIPVVVVSAAGPRVLSSIQADAVLGKPCDLGLLLRTVSDQVERRA